MESEEFKSMRDKALKQLMSGQSLTGKDALRKSGYIALSAARTQILLGSPNIAAAASVLPDPLPSWT
jgi:hypothetical protein